MRLTVLVSIAVLLAVSWPGFAQPSAEGGEFQINTYTTNNQYLPSVGVSAGGNFVVVWQSRNQDGSSRGIFGQLFDSSGAAINGEFQVNTTTFSDQRYPVTAIDAQGDFFVAWDSGGEVFGRLYDRSGAPATGEVQVNTYTTGNQLWPAIAMNPSGDFVVVWHSDGQDGNSWGIFGQAFEKNLTKVGGEFQVNTYTTGIQRYPKVDMARDGSFVVVWNDPEVFGQRFDASGGKQGGEFQVNTYTTQWQRRPDVTIAPNGDFVVAWSSPYQDGSYHGVFLQRYTSDGAVSGGELLVNAYTTGQQFGPALETSADGSFVVLWSGEDQGDTNGIFGRLFDSNGSALSGDFQLNTYTTHSQRDTVAGMDDAGNLVVAWSSATGLTLPPQDGDGSGSFGQRYRLPCSATTALPAGDWAMISLPCDPGASDTVADVFGDDMTGTYDLDWVVYARDEAAGAYTHLGLTSSLTRGEGYWIKTLDSGEAVTVDGLSTQVVEVALETDAAGVQNMVGHPFDFDVCWANVQVLDGSSVLSLDEADPSGECDKVSPGATCRMSRTMNKWGGAAYSPFDGVTLGAEGTLEPFDGFWVKAFKSGVKLRVPAWTSTSCTSGSPFADPRPRRRPVRSEGWYVRLIAESGPWRDAGNLFGQLPDSHDSHDVHDLKELDPEDATLTVVFPHEDWGDFEGVYTTDYHSLKHRSQADVWSFEVWADAAVTTATLRWEGPPWALAGIRLTDEETGRSIPMRPGGSYSFPLNRVRRFSCRLGPGQGRETLP